MKGMTMTEQENVHKLMLTVLLQNIQAMARDINHAIQAKLLSRWGMSSNQIIRQRNNLSTELIEQFGQLKLLMEHGLVAEEKPLDLVDQVKALVKTAPQATTKALDAPPGWTKDADGNWVTL